MRRMTARVKSGRRSEPWEQFQALGPQLPDERVIRDLWDLLSAQRPIAVASTGAAVPQSIPISEMRSVIDLQGLAGTPLERELVEALSRIDGEYLRACAKVDTGEGE